MRLTPELLLKAYSIGIFPMAESRDDPELHWIDPEKRGVLPFDGFHVPRRLKRLLRKGIYEVTCDKAFHEVVLACAGPTTQRPESWINPVIERLVVQLYHMGFAHSVETRAGDRLVGGLYGIALGGCFFGESMYSRERDASKVALVNLVLRLRKGGFRLLDTQFTTPHLRRFGVIEISRAEYRRQLAKAVGVAATFPTGPIRQEELTAFLESCL